VALVGPAALAAISNARLALRGSSPVALGPSTPLVRLPEGLPELALEPLEPLLRLRKQAVRSVRRRVAVVADSSSTPGPRKVR
jgi:hypothetical protein